MPTSGWSRRCTSGSRPTRRASTRPGSTTSRRTATAPPTAAPATAAASSATNGRPPPRPAERKPAAEPAAGPAAAAAAATPPAPHVDPTPTPAPVAKPRPVAKAAEPAKGTTSPVPKEQPPADAGRRQRRADLHRAARRPRPYGRPTWTSRSPCRPRRRSARCRSSCCGTTARSSTTTSPGRAAARCRSPTSSATRWSRRCGRCPEMNVGFDVVDGKPNLVTAGAHQPRPRHRRAEARRHPPAPGAVDQGRRDDGLRGVLDGVRGHRPQGPRQQAHRRGLPGHHDLADQPGRHRHQPLGPPADEGSGRDHRRRRDGVPARVAGRLGGRDRAQRDQQGHDADLDLRPPGHPGRPVGRVPQADARSCCSARTASSTRSSGRCGSPTSRSAGATTSRRPTTTRSASRPGSSS